MAVSVAKVGNARLPKSVPGRSSPRIRPDWDMCGTDGAAYELDASTFLLTEAWAVRGNADFTFFNNSDNTTSNAVEDREAVRGG